MNEIILDDTVLDVDTWFPKEVIEEIADIIKKESIMNEFVVIYNKETDIETYTEINENLEVVPFGKILYYKAYDDKDLPAYVRIGDWYPNVYKKVKMDGKTRLVKAPHLKHHITNFAGVGGFSFE